MTDDILADYLDDLNNTIAEQQNYVAEIAETGAATHADTLASLFAAIEAAMSALPDMWIQSSWSQEWDVWTGTRRGGWEIE